MSQTGSCYCGALSYEVTAAPIVKGQCHCRACQIVAGGAPQLFMALPKGGFRYTGGEPKTFCHPDLSMAVTRDFCETCGTHIATHRPDFDGVILKIGTLDAPEAFGGPKVAIYTAQKQLFHHIPDGVAAFEDSIPR